MFCRMNWGPQDHSWLVTARLQSRVRFFTSIAGTKSWGCEASGDGASLRVPAMSDAANDEFAMTKDEGSPNDKNLKFGLILPDSSFGFL